MGKRVSGESRGKRYVNRRVGGAFEKCLVAGPDHEIETVRPGIFEKTRYFRRKPDFARTRSHFRADAWRWKLRSATRRRTVRAAVRSGLARSAIERRPAPAEIRRRTAAHRAIERRHTSLQLLVDLLELVDPLQLMDRDAESGQNAHEEKREPQLQTPAD